MNLSIHNVISVEVKVTKSGNTASGEYFHKDIFVTCLENGNKVTHELTLFSANADQCQITEFPVEGITCGACTVAIGAHTMKPGCKQFSKDGASDDEK